ncbi:hypothetical protein LPJ77_001312 [Coemansia sp. RSA 2523]|nr:hypothetical protein LPJ77_001312 [Coemansia sp. RSA 2523]
MLRHWKALFYCFWLADKPLVQQELAWDLANLILACTDSNGVAFVRAFWETMCREWFDVDKHRVDKYLLLARRMVFFTFKAMQQSGWEDKLVGDYLAVYRDIPIEACDPKIPNSIRTHVGDVYVDELVRLASDIISESEDSQAETAAIPVAVLLEPFMRFIGSTSIRHLPAIIQESVFENIVVRIAEAEERNMAQGDGESLATVGSDVKDNEIADELLEKVQFLLDSIPEIKKLLLAVGGEEGTRASGRKRLHLIYQALCDTFPDEENDIVLSKRITISEPIGAQERKKADKHKRKKANKKRENKEKRKQKTELDHDIVSASAADFEVNALASEATAEDRRNYDADIVKIRDMEKRANTLIGVDDSTKPASKKAKRKEKQQTNKSSKQEDVPQLVPIATTEPARESTPTSVSASTAGDTSAWVVRDKRNGVKRPDNTKQIHDIASLSLLAETEKTIVVRNKPAMVATPVPARSKSNQRTTPENKNSANGSSDSGKKKRLGWALERNSVKRFLKKVPMLPSPEPISAAKQTVQLRSALRKDSAYGNGPLDSQPPLIPAQVTPTQKKRRVSVNGHPSTPVGGRTTPRKRNEHARELGNAVPTAPFFFLKPTSSYVTSPGKIEIPQGCVDHHEVELGVVIGKTGRDIRLADAWNHVAGYALGLDLTARNLQDEAKKKGLPWSAAKGFDTFTPIGPFIPASEIPDPHSVRLWIEVAGQVRQNGLTDAMIFQIPQLIEHISSIMTLEEGDLVLTGTPKGVGPILAGEHVVAGLEYQGQELSRIEFDAIQRS